MKKIFMGDLHSHFYRSNYPFNLYNHLGESSQAVEKNYIEIAKRERFNFLGLVLTSDAKENQLNLIQELERKYDGKNGFLVIGGEEIAESWGHIVSLGNPFILKSGVKMEEIIKNKSKDGVLIAAHPQGYWDRNLFLEYEKKEYFDSLEFGPWGGYDMKFIVDYCLEKRKREKKLSCSGSSDIHCQPWMLNRLGKTFILTENLTKESLLKAIKKGSCLGSFFEYLIGDLTLCKEYVHPINEKYKLNLQILK